MKRPPKKSCTASTCCSLAKCSASWVENRKSASVSEGALHLDGDKPNSVSRRSDPMIIYLIPLAQDARCAETAVGDQPSQRA